MLTIGVVGSGLMGSRHVVRLKSIEGVMINAVASLENPKEFIEKHELKAEAYTNAARLFEEANVDAVLICTPTGTHRKLIEQASKADLDIFCEKPLTGSLEAAKQIQKVVHDTGITLMVGHATRFFPKYRKLRTQLRDDVIGRVDVVHTRRTAPIPDWGWNDWYLDEEQNHSIFVELAIHDFDYLRWILGEVESLFARRTAKEDQIYTHTTLRFSDGAIGYVEAYRGQPSGRQLQTELQVAGENGMIEIDSSASQPIKVTSNNNFSDIDQNPLVQDAYQRELEEFISGIQHEEEPSLGVEEAIKSLRLAVAAEEAVESGQPIIVEEIEI